MSAATSLDRPAAHTRLLPLTVTSGHPLVRRAQDYFLPYFDEVLAFIMASLDREKIAPMAVPLEPGAEGAGEAGDDIEFLCQLIDSLGCLSVCLTDKSHIMKHVPQCMYDDFDIISLRHPPLASANALALGSHRVLYIGPLDASC